MRFNLELLTYQQKNTEKGIRHLPYETENYFMECIRTGNPEGILQYNTKDMEGYSIGKMSHFGKQDEYCAVITISLAARAAIDAGLSPQVCYDINDLFLQKVSLANNQKQYHQIIIDAFQTFADEVRKNKDQSSVPKHISLCKEYIFRHLSTPFSLEDLAAYVGLNPTYLSSNFHEYTGETITSYIQQQRIKAAMLMLEENKHSITEISNFLCFSSQSYFCKVFRDKTGITPGKYRKMKNWT